MFERQVLGEDYLGQAGKTQPILLSVRRADIRRLVRGEISIGVVLYNIAYTRSAMALQSTPFSRPRRAAEFYAGRRHQDRRHPNAAKLFLTGACPKKGRRSRSRSSAI